MTCKEKRQYKEKYEAGSTSGIGFEYEVVLGHMDIHNICRLPGYGSNAKYVSALHKQQHNRYPENH
jgi:hypothetical protein